MKPLHPYQYFSALVQRINGEKLSGTLSRITEKKQYNFSGKRLRVDDEFVEELYADIELYVNKKPEDQKDFIENTPGFKDRKSWYFQMFDYLFNQLYESQKIDFSRQFDQLFDQIPIKKEFSKDDVLFIQSLVSKYDLPNDEPIWSRWINDQSINFRDEFFNAKDVDAFTIYYNAFTTNVLLFFIAALDCLVYKYLFFKAKPHSLISFFFEEKSKSDIQKLNPTLKYIGKKNRRPFKRLLQFTHAIAYFKSTKGKAWPEKPCKPQELSRLSGHSTLALDKLFSGRERFPLSEYQQICGSIFKEFKLQIDKELLNPLYLFALIDHVYYSLTRTNKTLDSTFFGYMRFWEYHQSILGSANHGEQKLDWAPWILE